MIQIPVRDKIIMRSLTKNDAREVYITVDNNRAYLRKWLPWVDATNSPAVTENVIAEWANEYENKTDVVMGIFQQGEYIGNIGLHMKTTNNSGMIGYWLAAGHQGRGIISDCVRALVSYGFHTLDLNRICIYCASENKRSRAIPERLGFIQEGILQDGECVNGVYYDLFIYGMVRRNWNN